MEYNIVDVIANYASYAVFAALFIFLFRWVLGYFKETRKEYVKLLGEAAEREKSFREIIAQLSSELPQIKKTLERIERRNNNGRNGE